MRISINLERFNRIFLGFIIIGIIFTGTSYYLFNTDISIINQKISNDSAKMDDIMTATNRYFYLFDSRVAMVSTSNIARLIGELSRTSVYQNDTDMINALDNDVLKIQNDSLNKSLEDWGDWFYFACSNLDTCSIDNRTEINNTIASGDKDKFLVLDGKLSFELQKRSFELRNETYALNQSISHIQEIATLFNIIGLFFISIASYFGKTDKFSKKSLVGYLLFVIIIIILNLFVISLFTSI